LIKLGQEASSLLS